MSLKKRVRIVLSIAVSAGIAAGVGVNRITDRKRKRAIKENKHIPYGPYEAVIKRPLDLILALGALTVLSPVLAGTAFLVRWKLGSPVLFQQKRPGKDREIFIICKFRTMTDRKDADGVLLSDEERLTRFGKILRSTSLDELPELFNIIRGDMAIVGPRPLLEEYLPLYSERQGRRHNVRPGLTGLAQVSGRNNLSWEEKFEDDVRYVEKITFAGDLRIILKTVAAVLKREGINSQTSVTMEKFTGNESDKQHSDMPYQNRKAV